MNDNRDDDETVNLLLARLSRALLALCQQIGIENCGLDNPLLLAFLIDMLEGEID